MSVAREGSDERLRVADFTGPRPDKPSKPLLTKPSGEVVPAVNDFIKETEMEVDTEALEGMASQCMAEALTRPNMTHS